MFQSNYWTLNGEKKRNWEEPNPTWSVPPETNVRAAKRALIINIIPHLPPFDCWMTFLFYSPVPFPISAFLFQARAGAAIVRLNCLCPIKDYDRPQLNAKKTEIKKRNSTSSSIWWRGRLLVKSTSRRVRRNSM